MFNRMLILLLGLWGSTLAGKPALAMGLLTDGPETELREELAVVDSLRVEGQFRRVLGRLHALEVRYPECIEVLYRHAFAWSDLGKATDDEHRAVDYYRRAAEGAVEAVQTDPESAWAHLALAVAEGRLTQYVSTRERVERSRAVKVHAERAVALDLTLAGGYHVRGRWHREAADLNVLQRAAVRIVYGGLPDASIDQAVADYRRAIALESRTYHHLELGKTYLQLGRVEAAREQLQIAVALPPVDPFAPAYMAEARALLRKLK